MSSEVKHTFAAEMITTIPVGAAQGVAQIGEHFYVYGDIGGKAGLIIECDSQARPTGRTIHLPAPITHPTGLTHHERYGTFLGNSLHKQGTIYHIDFEQALKEGTVERAILNQTDDDLAHEGCRPEFITLAGDIFLATADYGDDDPAIRLLDPKTLQTAAKTSDPGVLLHRLPTGPYTQSLWWDAPAKNLVALRNITAGRGWAVDFIPLVTALKKGDAHDCGRWVLPPTTELEGGLRLENGDWMFVTSMRNNNVMIGPIE